MAIRNFYTYSDALEGKELVDQIKSEEPNTIIISHSQLKSWDRCEFKWYLGYVQGWTQKEQTKALTLGTLMHENLATWYGTGGDEAAVKALYAKHFNEYGYETDYMHLLAEEMWLMDMYMEWSVATDRSFQVETTEEHFIFALWTPAGRKYYLQGYVDVRGLDTSNNNMRWLWDHKSSTRFWTITEFNFDAQLPLYASAYSLHGIPIHGVCLNQLNTYPYKNREGISPEKLFKRDYNFLNHQQMSNLLTEVGYAVDSMIDSPATHTSPDEPLYGNPAIPRRRMSRDCSFCNFREPCLDGLKGYDIERSLEVNFIRKGEPRPTREDKENLTISINPAYLKG